MKSPGGTDFIVRNAHAAMTPGPFNADKWVSPAPEGGDLVLFPSYLMHAVSSHPGARRITLSFNAIAARPDSWGYRVRFDGRLVRPSGRNTADPGSATRGIVRLAEDRALWLTIEP